MLPFGQVTPIPDLESNAVMLGVVLQLDEADLALRIHEDVVATLRVGALHWSAEWRTGKGGQGEGWAWDAG